MAFDHEHPPNSKPKDFVRTEDTGNTPLCSVCGDKIEDVAGTCLCHPSHGSYHLACDPHKKEWWLQQFELMTLGDESLGSAGWRVGNATMLSFIRMIERRAKQPVSKDQAFMDIMEKELGVKFVDCSVDETGA
jgi:hypothetical protein